jgi:hypothetical protein
VELEALFPFFVFFEVVADPSLEALYALFAFVVFLFFIFYTCLSMIGCADVEKLCEKSKDFLNFFVGVVYHRRFVL